MKTIDKPGWAYRLLEIFSIVAFVELVILALIVHFSAKDFLWQHPWFHSFLVGLPAILFGLVEWKHSREANDLRRQSSQHLGKIANNTERLPTKAETNATILRKYLRKVASITEGDTQARALEIVEINENNIAILFSPASVGLGMTAYYFNVDCEETEIIEVQQGSCVVQVHVRKRYGPTISLGQITKWEERDQPKAKVFSKSGGAVASANYGKGGSAERRTLHIFSSTDGTNSFLLEASTGENFTGDNKLISKAFRSMDVEYKAAGFGSAGSNHGSGLKYPLFL
jgi:hypothetical protein